MNRRKFLSCAIGGAGLGVLGWRLGTGNSFGAGSLQLAKFSRQFQALGTDVLITIFHDNEQQALAALDAAVTAIDRVEDIMSLYRSHSQLSRLNRDGFLENPDRDLVTVLNQAIALAQRTDGAFDVSVQPLWELYAARSSSGKLPSQSEIDRACRLVDWRRIEVSSSNIRLHGADTKLTLNGIAQGFAADAACQAIKQAGVTSALVDAGEVGTLGRKPGKTQWTVGIKHPREHQELIGAARLDRRCLATSGDYETRFAENFQHHHLFDPRSGYSATELASLSVVAPTATTADALSTAAFVLGPEQGMQLIEATPGADAYYITKDGRTGSSPGFPLNQYQAS